MHFLKKCIHFLKKCNPKPRYKCRNAFIFVYPHIIQRCSKLGSVTAEWAAKLAKKAPLALAAAKSCVNVGAEADMPAALEYELREFLALFDSEDQKEGMNAFLEKRAAKFTGK